MPSGTILPYAGPDYSLLVGSMIDGTLHEGRLTYLWWLPGLSAGSEVTPPGHLSV